MSLLRLMADVELWNVAALFLNRCRLRALTAPKDGRS